MNNYIKPAIKTLELPEIMQGIYETSTPEEQLAKPDVDISNSDNEDDVWGLENFSVWSDE